MVSVDNAVSSLRLDKLYFNRILFNRIKTEEDVGSSQVKVHIGVSDPITEKDTFEMGITAIIEDEHKYHLEVELSGRFYVDGGLTEENKYLSKNAAAIMFPYLRSEITLLTSQPDLKPVVLPPLNINNIMKK